MAVIYEYQVYVECDGCQRHHAEVGRVKDIISTLRHEGWSIGKKVLCPDCKRERRNHGR